MLNLNLNTKYVVAFSGGADSALLAFQMKQEGYSIRLAHVMHPESKASTGAEHLSMFCRDWAEKYNLKLDIIKISVDPSLLKSKGTEAAEREARYHALFQNLNDDEVLVTGHHLDDSIETFLFRMARGTSVNGLSGISSVSNQSRLVRPLISYNKKKILQLVDQSAILYGHDSNNDNTELSRSFIRNKIVPLFVEQFSFEKFYSSMKRLMENMSECSELIEDLYNIDFHNCAINESEICRVSFGELSDARQKNFLYHFISKQFNLFLSKKAIDEIRKRAKSSKLFNEFTISQIKITIKKDVLRCELM